MKARQIRVGGVQYLNTTPLVYNFPVFAPSAELVFDVPSRLADRLSCRRARRSLDPFD